MTKEAKEINGAWTGSNIRAIERIIIEAGKKRFNSKTDMQNIIRPD